MTQYEWWWWENYIVSAVDAADVYAMRLGGGGEGGLGGRKGSRDRWGGGEAEGGRRRGAL